MLNITHEQRLRGLMQDKIEFGEVDPNEPGFDESRTLLIIEQENPDLWASAQAYEERRRLSTEKFNRQMAVEDAKPGPPKLFPAQFNLRLSAHERSALDRIASATKEGRAEIIRRLIREADPAPIQ